MTTRLRALGLRLAATAGTVARGVHRYGAGLAGGACVVTGAALIYPPAAWVVAGALLLILDQKAA